MAGQTPKYNYCDIILCEGETYGRRRLTRRPSTEAMAHHHSKIVGGDLDRVALLHIGDTAQPRPAQGADIENVGKAALDLLAAPLERGPGDTALQPGPVVVDRAAGGDIAVPAGEALLLLLGYARRPRAVLQRLQAGPGMTAGVGDQLGRGRRRRRTPNEIEHRLGVRQRARKGLGVSLVGRVDLDRHDHLGVEIDGVFGLVAEMGP